MSDRFYGSKKLQEEDPCYFDFFHDDDPTSGSGCGIFSLDSNTLEPRKITLFICTHVASDTFGLFLRSFRSGYEFE